jgi:hypothetical protein
MKKTRSRKSRDTVPLSQVCGTRSRSERNIYGSTTLETVYSYPVKLVELNESSSSVKRRNMMKIRKKKTSGYAIFCSEVRRRYANESPDLQFADISKKVRTYVIR